MKTKNWKWLVSIFITVFCFGVCSSQKGPAKYTGFGVQADIAPLKRVILLAPGNDLSRSSYWNYLEDILLGVGYDDGNIEQHKRMADILNQNSIEVLDLETLLANALVNASSSGQLDKELKEMFPYSYKEICANQDRLKASGLLGRQDEFYYNYDEKGRFVPLIDPSIALYFTRDFAVMTQQGLLLTNAKESWRKLEHKLGRFMFKYADELKDIPIAFDAEIEEVYCEGGDILVKDADTILMGINNFSDAAAAEKIAKKLNVDVIGVQMPPYDDRSGANVQIMHLDTVFNLVAEKKALITPYLFEEKYATQHPIADLLHSVDEAMKLMENSSDKNEKSELKYSLAKAVKHIPDVGWLTRYKSGSGEADELHTKLEDFLRKQGYSFIYVGGEQGELSKDKYIMERVLYELSLQAANVVQLEPGKVLAYAHNSHTINSLRENGIEVLTFEGKYLADGGGGPHCLTMPVLRIE